MGDVFAVLWYRQHAQLDKIWKLAPWVVLGMVAGGSALYFIGEKQGRDLMSPIIGGLVLVMITHTYKVDRNGITGHVLGPWGWDSGFRVRMG